jgi:hypothetical protein
MHHYQRRRTSITGQERGQPFNIDIITGGTEEAGMPRQARIEFEGAMDQVMARGDRREAIVHDDGDRRTFVRTLGEAGGSLAESRTELFKDGTGGVAESAQGG